MKTKIHTYFKLSLLLLLVSFSSFCQDIKCAFLQTKWVSGYKYSGELYLLTNLSTNVFRPYVLLNWGSQTDTLKYLQSNVYSNTIINKFEGSFTYPGQGIYTLIYNEPYRISGINNITNSHLESIQITSTLIINSFSGPNTSPLFQNYPINLGKTANEVYYMPNYIDIDGDSLSYSLINCTATNYYSSFNTNLYNNGTLGYPKDSIGVYAFSYLIKEWRKTDGNYSQIGISQIDFVMDINNSIGIEEIENTSNIGIYPNPNSGSFTLQTKEDVVFEIVNELGQIVKTIKLDGSNNHQITITGLADGVYCLKDKLSGNVIKNKIVVVR